MEKHEYIISVEEEGLRVDKCIAMRLGEGYSRTYVKFLIDGGFVRVNGDSVKPRYAVKEGDIISAELASAGEPFDLGAEDIPVDILYEDEWLVVINKFPGMVVHPGSGNRKGTLVNALLHHCGKLPASDDEFRPGIVHRLDKDTSGVMVVARNSRAMRILAEQFQSRKVKKNYIAVVAGIVQLDNGIIDIPISRHETDRKKMDISFEKGKEACTIYHVLERFDKFTLVSLELKTGRTHQIRVHMKHLGYPVAGDITYGGRGGITRQALHSEVLGFTHPGTGKYVEFKAPLPEDMVKFINDIRKKGGE